MRTYRGLSWIPVSGSAVASAVVAVLILSACGAGTSASAPAAKGSPILLGSDGHGVRVDRRLGLTFIFDRSAAGRYRQIAGRKVLMECDQITRRSDTPLLLDTTSAVAELRAPQHRVPIDSGFGGPSDFCRLALPLPNNQARVVATVALTSLGYYYLDQQRVAQNVFTLAILPSSALLTYGQRVLNAIAGTRLPSEGATPPAGKFGFSTTPASIATSPSAIAPDCCVAATTGTSTLSAVVIA